MESVLERMQRENSDKKIADFMAKEKQPYSFKKRYAAIRAREFAAECDRREIRMGPSTRLYWSRMGEQA